MRRATSSLGGVVLGIAILLSGDAVAQEAVDSQSMAPLWTVHIDEVQPKLAAEFERLNIAENQGIHAIMRKNGQPIQPVFEIVTSGSVYMSLRPKLSLTDIEKPSTIPDSVSQLFSTVTDSLDAPIHATLRYHHNQIWRYKKDESYFPSTPGYLSSTPRYIRLVSERVIPRMLGRYGSLLDSLKEALGKSNYPWAVLVFSSSYGDGSYKYLWQADSKEQFLKSGDRSAVLAAVFGKKAARKMLADWQSCLAGAEAVDATPHRAFSDLDSSVAWLGMQK